MQKDYCKSLVNHIHRLSGQLNTLAGYIENERNCDDVMQLAMSATKSFDSLKSKVIEAYVNKEIIGDEKLSFGKTRKFQKMLSLIKT